MAFEPEPFWYLAVKAALGAGGIGLGVFGGWWLNGWSKRKDSLREARAEWAAAVEAVLDLTIGYSRVKRRFREAHDVSAKLNAAVGQAGLFSVAGAALEDVSAPTQEMESAEAALTTASDRARTAVYRIRLLSGRKRDGLVAHGTTENAVLLHGLGDDSLPRRYAELKRDLLEIADCWAMGQSGNRVVRRLRDARERDRVRQSILQQRGEQVRALRAVLAPGNGDKEADMRRDWGLS
jgi:hypothetical protein